MDYYNHHPAYVSSSAPPPGVVNSPLPHHRQQQQQYHQPPQPILSPDRGNPSDPTSVLEFCEDVGPCFRDWLEEQKKVGNDNNKNNRKRNSKNNNNSPIDQPLDPKPLLYCALCRQPACHQSQLEHFSPGNTAPHHRPYVQTHAELIDKLEARGFIMYDGVPHCFRCAKRFLKEVLYPHFKSAQGHGGALIMERIAEVDDLSVKQSGYLPALEKLNLVVVEASERSTSSSSAGGGGSSQHYTDSLFESIAFQLFRYRPLGFLLRLLCAERALSEQAVYQGFVCPRHFDPSNPYHDQYQASETLRFLQFLDNMTEPNSDGSSTTETHPQQQHRHHSSQKQQESSSARFVPMVLRIIASYFGVNVHLIDPSRAIDGRWHTMISAPQSLQQQHSRMYNNNNTSSNSTLENVPGEVYILAVNETPNESNNTSSHHNLMNDVSAVSSAVNNSFNQPLNSKRIYHSLVASPKDILDVVIPYLKWLKATSMSTTITQGEDGEEYDNIDNNNDRHLIRDFSPISSNSNSSLYTMKKTHQRSKSTSPFIEQQSFVAAAKTPKDDDDDDENNNDQNETKTNNKNKRKPQRGTMKRGGGTTRGATSSSTRTTTNISPLEFLDEADEFTPTGRESFTNDAEDSSPLTALSPNQNQSRSSTSAKVLHVPRTKEDVHFMNFKTFFKNRGAKVGFGSKIALEFNSAASSSSSPLTTSLLGISSFLQPTLVNVTKDSSSSITDNCLFEVKSVRSIDAKEGDVESNDSTKNNTTEELHNTQCFALLHCQTGLWLTLSQDDNTDEFWLSFCASVSSDSKSENAIWRFVSSSSKSNNNHANKIENFTQYQLESVPSASFPTPFVVMCSHHHQQQQQQSSHNQQQATTTNSINVYPKSRISPNNRSIHPAMMVTRIISFSSSSSSAAATQIENNKNNSSSSTSKTSSSNSLDTASCEYFQIIYTHQEDTEFFLAIRNEEDLEHGNSNKEQILYLTTKTSIQESINSNIESTFFKFERFPSSSSNNIYYRLFSFDGREVVSHVKHHNDLPSPTSLASLSSPARIVHHPPRASSSSSSPTRGGVNSSSMTDEEKEMMTDEEKRKEKLSAAQQHPKLVAIEKGKNAGKPISPFSAWKVIRKSDDDTTNGNNEFFISNKNELYYRDYHLVAAAPAVRLSPSFDIDSSFKIVPVSSSSSSNHGETSTPHLLQKMRKIQSLATCSTQFVAAVSAERISESMLRVLSRTLSSSLQECLSWLSSSSSSTKTTPLVNYLIKNQIVFHLMRIIQELIPQERIAIVAAATKQQQQSSKSSSKKSNNTNENSVVAAKHHKLNTNNNNSSYDNNALDQAAEEEELMAAFHTIAVALDRNPSIAFELVLLVFRCFELLTEIFNHLRQNTTAAKNNSGRGDVNMSSISTINNTVTSNLIYRVARFAIEYCPLVELKGIDFAMAVLRTSSGNSFVFSPDEIQDIVVAVLENVRGRSGGRNSANDVDPALFSGYFKVLSSVITKKKYSNDEHQQSSSEGKNYINDTDDFEERVPLRGPQSLCGDLMLQLKFRLFGLSLDRSQSVVVAVPENISNSHFDDTNNNSGNDSPNPEQPLENNNTSSHPRKMTMTLESLIARAFSSSSRSGGASNTQQQQQKSSASSNKYRLIMTAEERAASREQRAYFAAVLDAITCQLDLFNDLCQGESSAAKENIVGIFSGSSALVSKAVLEEICFQTRSISNVENNNNINRDEQTAVSRLRSSALRLLITITAFAARSSFENEIGNNNDNDTEGNHQSFDLHQLLASPVIHLRPEDLSDQQSRQQPSTNNNTKKQKKQKKENEDDNKSEGDSDEEEELIEIVSSDNNDNGSSIGVVAEIRAWSDVARMNSSSSSSSSNNNNRNKKPFSQAQEEQKELVLTMIYKFLVDKSWNIMNPHPASVTETTISVIHSLTSMISSFTAVDENVFHFYKKLISVIIFGDKTFTINNSNEEEQEEKETRKTQTQQQYTRGRDFDSAIYKKCCHASLRLLSTIVDAVLIQYSVEVLLPLFSSTSSDQNKFVLDNDQFCSLLNIDDGISNDLLNVLVRLTIRLSPSPSSSLAFTLICKIRCFPLYCIGFLMKNCRIEASSFATAVKTPNSTMHHHHQSSSNQMINEMKRAFVQEFLAIDLWQTNVQSVQMNLCPLLLEIEPRGRRALKCVAENSSKSSSVLFDTKRRNFLFITSCLAELFQCSSSGGPAASSSCDCEVISAAESFLNSWNSWLKSSATNSLEEIKLVRALIQKSQSSPPPSLLQYLLTRFVFVGESGSSNFSSASSSSALFASSNFGSPFNPLRDELIPLLADIVVINTNTNGSSNNNSSSPTSTVLLSICDLFIGVLRALWVDALAGQQDSSSLLICVQASLNSILALVSSTDNNEDVDHHQFLHQYLSEQGLFVILVKMLMHEKKRQEQNPAKLRIKELCLLILIEVVSSSSNNNNNVTSNNIKTLLNREFDASELIVLSSASSSLIVDGALISPRTTALASSSPAANNSDDNVNEQQQQQQEQEIIARQDFIDKESGRITVLALNLMYLLDASSSSSSSSKCGSLQTCPALKNDLGFILRAKYSSIRTVRMKFLEIGNSSSSARTICFEDETQKKELALIAQQVDDVAAQELDQQKYDLEREMLLDNFICSHSKDSKEFMQKCHDVFVSGKNDGSDLQRLHQELLTYNNDDANDQNEQTKEKQHQQQVVPYQRASFPSSSATIEKYQNVCYFVASLVLLTINILLLIESDNSHHIEGEAEKIFVNFKMPSQYKYPMFALGIALVIFDLLGVIITIIVVLSNITSSTVKFDIAVQIFTSLFWLGFAALGLFHSAVWYSMILFRLVSLIPACVAVLKKPHLVGFLSSSNIHQNDNNNKNVDMLSIYHRRESPHPFSTTSSLNIARFIPVVFLAMLSVAGVYFVFSSVVFFHLADLVPASFVLVNGTTTANEVCSSLSQCFARAIYFGFNSNNNANGDTGIFYPLLTNYSSFSSAALSSSSSSFLSDPILFFWIFFESSISVIIVAILVFYLATIIQRFVQVATLDDEMKKHFDRKEKMIDQYFKSVIKNGEGDVNENAADGRFVQFMQLCRYITARRSNFVELTPMERKVWKSVEDRDDSIVSRM